MHFKLHFGSVPWGLLLYPVSGLYINSENHFPYCNCIWIITSNADPLSSGGIGRESQEDLEETGCLWSPRTLLPFRAQPCNLELPSRQRDVPEATPLEPELLWSVSGSHIQENRAMSKGSAIMQESVYVSQVMLMKMMTEGHENWCPKCRQALSTEHRVLFTKGSIFWSPWRFSGSSGLMNQDLLVKREIFIAGSPHCDPFFRVSSPREGHSLWRLSSLPELRSTEFHG